MFFVLQKDPDTPKFIGRIFAYRDSKLGDLEEEVRKLLPNVLKEDVLEFYEEVRYKSLRVDLLQKSSTLKDLQIGSGDLITVQIKAE